jgi:hypothetical protein
MILRKNKIMIRALLCLVSVLLAMPISAKTPSQIASEILPAVVMISTDDKNAQPLGIGSGFFVSAQLTTPP